MTIKGLVFDFDGLILDTETPEFQVLQEIFQSYGTSLPLSKWAAALGASFAAFDPMAYLATLTSQPVDQALVYQDWKKRSLDLIEKEPPLPGIGAILEDAVQKGLKMAVASSSPCNWVESHLTRLGLIGYFDHILASNDVTHIKPHPELYQTAVRRLGLEPSEVIAFEDSPNGIKAARAAGLYCVAVLNPITSQLDTAHANLVLDSLAGVSLDTLINQVESR